MLSKLLKGAAAAMQLDREMTEIENKGFAKDHPLSDDSLRDVWRAAGGSFHGAAPEFFASMPEAQMIPLLRRSALATTMLVESRAKGPVMAEFLDLVLCGNCRSVHVVLSDKDSNILAHGSLSDIDKAIADLQELKRQLAQDSSARVGLRH